MPTSVPTSDFIRWSGLAAMLGGVLFILAELLDVYNFVLLGEDQLSAGAVTASYALEVWMFVLGDVLLLFGLFGLYVSQSETGGPLLLIGFLVAFLGTALAVGVDWPESFLMPLPTEDAPDLLALSRPLLRTLPIGIYAIGWLLFGVAALRARVYPRWAALLLIVGAVLSFIPQPLSTAPLGLAVAWMGFILFTGRGAPPEQMPRVR